MKKIFSILSIVFLTLSSVSCVVDDETPKEEFTQTPNAVGFKTSAKGLNVLLTGNVVNHLEPVDLIAGMDNTRNNPEITIGFEIDPSSTATLGLEYTLPGGLETKIEAGKDFGYIPIDINSANIVVGAPKTIVINLLTTSSGIIPARNKKITITLTGICVSDLAGSYSNDQNANQAVITEIGPGSYRVSYLAPFASTYWFEFSDVCGVLTITNWEFQDSNPITALPGSVAADGSLVFPDVSVAGVPWFNNLAITYTPN